MEAFEFFIGVMGDVLESIFMHEMFAGTGVSFLDFGIFILIVGIVIKALVNSVQVTDEGMTSKADRDRAERERFAPKTYRTTRSDGKVRESTTQRIK